MFGVATKSMLRTLSAHDFMPGSPGLALLGEGWAESTDRGTWLAAPTGSVMLPPPPERIPLGLEVTLDPQFNRGVAQLAHSTVALGDRVLGTRAILGSLRWLLLIPADIPHSPMMVRISAVDENGDSCAVLLSRITVVEAQLVQLPASRVPLRELRFGVNDNDNAWLGEGWGSPEDEFVWAIGARSTMRLPVLPDGSAQCALLDMRPFFHSLETALQRVVIRAEGSAPLRIDLRDRLINAIPLRPPVGQTEVALIFENLDADYETSDPLFHFGKPFAWAISSARIMPAAAKFYPGARPPVPGSLTTGTMRDAVAARLGMSVAEVADKFISLGNCCEFGNLQRSEGKDRPGLLRLTAIRQRELIEGLFKGFEGIGRIEHLSHHDIGSGHAHWRIIEAFYTMSFGTPFMKTVPFPSIEMFRQSRRLPRLAEKLIEDMLEADRVFIFRIADPGAGEPAILALQAALSRYGDANVVWLVNDGSRPAGSAERIASGIVLGHIETPDAAFSIPPETVVSVMTNAVILLRQGQPLPA